MKKIDFKTNIKCSGCVEKVSNELNLLVGNENWKVDLQNADRILSIMSDDIGETEIESALSKVGFQAEPLSAS